MIDEYLKNIKEAVYGEEVRGSIYDAIKQCYDDATGNPDSVAGMAGGVADCKDKINKLNDAIKGIKSADLVVHGWNDVDDYAECGETEDKYTTVPAFINTSGGNLSFLYTKKTDYQITINKKGLYLFAIRVGVNSTTANKRVNFAPFVNGERVAALGSSHNTAGNFWIFQVETLPMSLSAGDAIDFRIAPTEKTNVKLRIVDISVYAIDWDGKVPSTNFDSTEDGDNTGGNTGTDSEYAAEVKDIRTGEDGTVYGSAGEAVREQVKALKKSVSDGKSQLAAAITKKGVETASDATFTTMAENVEKIESGGGGDYGGETTINKTSPLVPSWLIDCKNKGTSVTVKEYTE